MIFYKCKLQTSGFEMPKERTERTKSASSIRTQTEAFNSECKYSCYGFMNQIIKNSMIICFGVKSGAFSKKMIFEYLSKIEISACITEFEEITMSNFKSLLRQNCRSGFSDEYTILEQLEIDGLLETHNRFNFDERLTIKSQA